MKLEKTLNIVNKKTSGTIIETRNNKIEHLKQLFQEMANITLPLCLNNECGAIKPFCCCNILFCQGAIRYAKEVWNEELQKTTNTQLPLLGDDGCIAPPHLRPSCTFHLCYIDKFGHKPGDEEWTKKYWKLREEIELLQMELGIF